MGGAYVLQSIWERLGLDKAIAGALKERELRTAIQKEVFFATADLFNLEVDLVFFDTTSTYIERDGGRRGRAEEIRPFERQKARSSPSGHRAGSNEGIPVRCWVLPRTPLT